MAACNTARKSFDDDVKKRERELTSQFLARARAHTHTHDDTSSSSFSIRLGTNEEKLLCLQNMAKAGRALKIQEKKKL
jgi:hypothetical protein